MLRGCIQAPEHFYEYNNLGQKTSMTVPLGVNNKAKKICYSYDSEGKLVGTHVLPATATSSVSTATSEPGDLRFHYDDNGNRVKLINQDGDVYYFVYDPTASIPAVLVEIEATGSSQYLNIREPDGSLVSRETYNDSGTMTCHRTYHFDGLGSVVALSDENGTLTDKYTYGEWGNDPTHTDPDTGDAIGLTLDNPYQYVGQYGYYTHHQQADFKLLQLGVRYYDPETGRFTQKDPAKDGLNWYAYVGGNPLGAVDPSGLFEEDPDHPGHPKKGYRPGCKAGMSMEEILERIAVLEEMIRNHGPGTDHPVESDLKNLEKALDICLKRKQLKEEHEKRCPKTVWDPSEAKSGYQHMPVPPGIPVFPVTPRPSRPSLPYGDPTLPTGYIIVGGVVIVAIVIATLPEGAVIYGGLCVAGALAH